MPIIVPGTIASSDKFAIGENVVAGNAMPRRAQSTFGGLLDLNPTGTITCGIGIASTNGPTVSLIGADQIMAGGQRAFDAAD